jgi:hypothetical protein
MKTRQSWTDITYRKGRYDAEFNPYKEDKTKLVWNVFNECNGEICPLNIFEYNYKFLEDLLIAKRKHKDNFEEFAEYVRKSLQYYYWSKSEYETVITTWPPYIESEELNRLNKEKHEREIRNRPFYRDVVNLTTRYKIDIYTQVMMNWDRFIDYIWNNKHLLTKKKLGLDR